MTLSKELRQYRSQHATLQAKATLKPGDILTVTHCPGTKRWIRFVRWDRDWICSVTRDDYSACSVSKVNGVAVDFTEGWDQW